MNKLVFATNKPIALHLHAIEGKERESQFGGPQHLFSAEEGVFYVSEAAGKMIAAQLKKLSVQPGDLVEICKAEVDQGRGRKSVMWQVAVPLPEGNTPEPPPPAPVAVMRPIAVPAPQVAQDATARPRWADVLITQANLMVDVYAAVLRHAGDNHGSAVKPEDVRNLLTTTFINLAQRGGLNSNA
jgi:hypothetical protein